MQAFYSLETISDLALCSNLMNRRNPEIFKALFEELLDRVMAYAPKHKFKFKNPLYAIDSTTIDLCLSRYNWTYYRKHKGAIKLHTELDLSGNLPCFLLMSNGKMSDIRAAEENNPILPDSIVSQIKNLAFCGMKLFGTQVFNLPVQEELFSPLLR